MKNMTRDQCRRGYTTVTWHTGQFSESLASRQASTSSDTALPVPADMQTGSKITAHENLSTGNQSWPFSGIF